MAGRPLSKNMPATPGWVLWVWLVVVLVASVSAGFFMFALAEVRV